MSTRVAATRTLIPADYAIPSQICTGAPSLVAKPPAPGIKTPTTLGIQRALHRYQCSPEVFIEWMKHIVFKPRDMPADAFFMRINKQWSLVSSERIVAALGEAHWVYYNGRWKSLGKLFLDCKDELQPIAWELRPNGRTVSAKNPYGCQGPFNVFRGYIDTDSKHRLKRVVSRGPYLTDYMRYCWCAGDEARYKWLVQWFKDALFADRPRKEVLLIIDRGDRYGWDLIHTLCETSRRAVAPLSGACLSRDSNMLESYLRIPGRMTFHMPTYDEVEQRFGPPTDADTCAIRTCSSWLDARRTPVLHCEYNDAPFTMVNHMNLIIYVKFKRSLPALHESVVVFDSVPCFEKDPEYERAFYDVQHHVDDFISELAATAK